MGNLHVCFLTPKVQKNFVEKRKGGGGRVGGVCSGQVIKKIHLVMTETRGTPMRQKKRGGGWGGKRQGEKMVHKRHIATKGNSKD